MIYSYQHCSTYVLHKWSHNGIADFIYVDACSQIQDTLVGREPYSDYELEVEHSFSSNESSSEEEHWENSEKESLNNLDHDTFEELLKGLENDDPPEIATNSKDSLFRVILMFLFLWASFYKVSVTALNHLFAFFHHMFSTIVTNPSVIMVLGAVFPPSLYMAQKHFSIQDEKFENFVICEKCSSLYDYEDCLERVGTKTRSKRCYHIEYRNHPHPSQRMPCNQKLLKEVVTKKEKNSILLSVTPIIL